LRVFISLLFLLSTTSSWSSSYYPKEYKELFENGYGSHQDVKESLFLLLVKSHQRVSGGEDRLVNNCVEVKNCYRQESLGYRGARRVLFGTLHLQEDDDGYFVNDLYCTKKVTSKVTNIGPGKIPNSSVMNTEHLWPQSRFSNAFPAHIQKSDLHHLFPSISNANSVRGNSEFAEVNGFPVRNCKGSFQGVQRRFSGNYFEPPAISRGNIARALFYFSVRYKLKIRETEESYLRKWHEDDPVDLDEMNRNDGIYDVQGNRNPFIDYPHLVDEVSNF